MLVEKKNFDIPMNRFNSVSKTTICQKIYIFTIFFLKMGITKTDNAENIPSAVMVMMPPAIESTTTDSQTPAPPFYKKHWKWIVLAAIVAVAIILMIVIPAAFFTLSGSSVNVHVGDVHINHAADDSDTTISRQRQAATTTFVQKIAVNTEIQCGEYTNVDSCMKSGWCDWNEFEYQCMTRFEFLEDSYQQTCSTRYSLIETENECALAGTYFGLQDVSVSVRKFEKHPPGCYFFNNHLHLNLIGANRTKSLSEFDITEFQTLCEIKPGHCFNNVVDCKEGETAVDCGDVCKKECTENENLCTTTTSPPYCKRAVQYYDSGWVYNNRNKKIAYTKLMGIDCTSAEETYDTNFGKCVINSNGQLYIDVRNFPDTSSICSLHAPGKPVSYSENAAPEDLCSYMYYTHPGGVNSYNIPNVYTRDEFDDMTFAALRQELQCTNSLDNIGEGETYYWEKCCFV